MKQIKRVLDMIQKGELKVRWDSWFFSGGRDYGDGDIYRLYTSDGRKYGDLEVNLRNGLSFSSNMSVYFNSEEIDDEELMNKAEEVLTMALKRDDPAFVAMLTKDGETFALPRDYGDISRKQVMKGEWK